VESSLRDAVDVSILGRLVAPTHAPYRFLITFRNST
jgi:hypothetical protein